MKAFFSFQRSLIGLGLAAVLSTGCERVDVQPKNAPDLNTPQEKITQTPDVYRMDGPGGLFKDLKWYHYDMGTHIIWPLFDVFAVKTADAIYLLQIQSYYLNGPQTAGNYKISVKSQGGRVRQLQLDGSGCGNPFTNLEFSNCLKDPSKNVFTYVNLKNLSTFRAPEKEANLNRAWDIGFRGTEIILNSGPERAGMVRGALAHRFPIFFDSTGAPDLAQLRKPANQDLANSGFLALRFQEDYNYALPDGIDRVLHESFWMKEDLGGRRSKTQNYTWIVRGKNQKSFAKVQVDQVIDTPADDGFDSRISLRFFLQRENDAVFSRMPQTAELFVSTKNRLKSFCLRFESNEVLDCSAAGGDWDLKFTAVNTKKDKNWSREWRIFTNAGAQGPFVPEEAAVRNSGRN